MVQHRMRRFAFHVVLLALVCLLPSRVVFADAATENKAKALQKKAMDDDYLVNVNAQAAETKLKQAIAMCGGNKCGNSLVAALKRDLGTVLAGMLNATRQRRRGHRVRRSPQARSVNQTRSKT